MPKSDPLEILLAHDQWGTRLILDACAKLTPEQFHQRFDIGVGSLHDTMLHILSAMRTWTQTLAGQEVEKRIDQDGRRRTPAELLALQEEFANHFAAQAHRRPLDEMVSRSRDDKTFHFTRGAVLMQVTTHGMHHRAQCLNMLRHLGVKPLPLSSIAEWVRTADTTV